MNMTFCVFQNFEYATCVMLRFIQHKIKQAGGAKSGVSLPFGNDH